MLKSFPFSFLYEMLKFIDKNRTIPFLLRIDKKMLIIVSYRIIKESRQVQYGFKIMIVSDVNRVYIYVEGRVEFMNLIMIF